MKTVLRIYDQDVISIVENVYRLPETPLLIIISDDKIYAVLYDREKVDRKTIELDSTNVAIELDLISIRFYIDIKGARITVVQSQGDIRYVETETAVAH